MSVRAVALVGIVIAPAALAAGYLQGLSTPPPPASNLRPPAAPTVERPGKFAEEAASYLARLNTPPPPPPPINTGPPPIDVAVLFRRDYAGIINPTGSDPQVMLGRARKLKVGDIYRDGWKLASINGSTMVLQKGTDTRRIGAFSPPAPSEAAANAAAAAPTAPLSLSNGLREGQLTGTQLNNIESAGTRLGLTPAQRLTLRSQLTQGTVNQQSITQLIQGLRPPPSAAAITAFLNALAQAGVITPQIANQLSQTLPQIIAAQAAGRGPTPPPVNVNRGPVNNGAPAAPGANRGGGPGFAAPGGGNRGGGPGGNRGGGPGGAQNFGGRGRGG